MTCLWETWIPAEGKFNDWELGKLMKSTQVLGHHYKQPIDVLYQVALDKD